MGLPLAVAAIAAAASPPGATGHALYGGEVARVPGPRFYTLGHRPPCP